MRVTMNKGESSHCAYCEESTTDIAVSGQRCISKKSSELCPYVICHACYSILSPSNYLQNAERIRGKQIFWDKVDKNLRKRRRAGIEDDQSPS